MALTFEQIVKMRLVSEQSRAAAAWLMEAIDIEFGTNLSYRMSTTPYDSPLEAVFEFWWIALRAAGHISRSLELVPQKQVTVGDRRYRLDFAVELNYQEQRAFERDGIRVPQVCVELDGHEFHERTKEQVAHRNQRDRDLQAAGWSVLHYSGSELVRDPVTVIEDFDSKAGAIFWAPQQEYIDRMAAGRSSGEGAAT